MTPTQADREAAIAPEDRELFILLMGFDAVERERDFDRIRNGHFDGWRKMQLIARHRLAAEAAAFEKAAGVALREARDETNGKPVRANAGIIYQDIRKLAGEKHE